MKRITIRRELISRNTYSYEADEAQPGDPYVEVPDEVWARYQALLKESDEVQDVLAAMYGKVK